MMSEILVGFLISNSHLKVMLIKKKTIFFYLSLYFHSCVRDRRLPQQTVYDWPALIPFLAKRAALPSWLREAT